MGDRAAGTEVPLTMNGVTNGLKGVLQSQCISMALKTVVVIHDTEHDSANDDAISHAGLLRLVSRGDIETLVLVASGADPDKSNLAAKTQVLQYSELFHPLSLSAPDAVPLVCEVEYLLRLPPFWAPRVRFFETAVGGGSGTVADLPAYLKERSLSANTIPNENAEDIVERISAGAVICAHAPGYAQFLKTMHASGADFSRSTIIIQGAPADDQVASTYNEKDGWNTPKERHELLQQFEAVKIHDRVIANKHFQLGAEELELVGEALVDQGYRTQAEDYVREASYGPRSISFLKTGPLVASRQPFAMIKGLWTERGPYSPMLPDLNRVLSDISSICVHYSYPEFHDWFMEEFAHSTNKSVVSEKDQAMTTIGIQELHDSMPEGLLGDSVTPLGLRVALMLHLAKGGEFITTDDESIAEFLRAHCKRTIFDPVSLFFVHNILKTKESTQVELVCDENAQGFQVLRDIDLQPSRNETLTSMPLINNLVSLLSC